MKKMLEPIKIEKDSTRYQVFLKTTKETEFPNYRISELGNLYHTLYDEADAIVIRQLQPSYSIGSKNVKYGYVGINGKCVCIHRLVAKAYVPNSDPGTLTEVDHIDSNTHNNCSYNLQWVTHEENVAKSKRAAIHIYCQEEDKFYPSARQFVKEHPNFNHVSITENIKKKDVYKKYGLTLTRA